jgi:Flp pilus assembly protein TadB
MPTRREADTIRITTAPVTHASEQAGRQRRYLISMGVRTACFLGAVVVGPGWLRWVLVAGAVLLPYVAVVFANAEGRRDDGYQLRDPGPHEQLPELESVRSPRPRPS